jgi:hypothetical protein
MKRYAPRLKTDTTVVIGAVRLAARCSQLDHMVRKARVPDAAEWARLISEEYKRPKPV